MLLSALTRCKVIFGVLISILCFTTTDAHGYMCSPRSRNCVAFEDGKWSGQTENDPEKEECPHCLNLGGTAARCGKTARRNYDYPKNGLGRLMRPNTQAEYREGQEIIIDVVLTAHHKGHFTYKVCPVQPGEVPTQACFDKNPLIFKKDMLYGGRRDKRYPERAYIAPKTVPNAVVDTSGIRGMKFSHKFKLPDGVHGSLVLIQWHYMTANSCVHEGYDSYKWPKGWNDHGNLGVCKNIPEDGNGVPEQFWNCAEVRINAKTSTRRGPRPPRSTPTSQSKTSDRSSKSSSNEQTKSSGQSSLFCGTSWTLANEKCSKQCPSGIDAECSNGQRCYKTACNANNRLPLFTKSPRCGKDWAHAVKSCNRSCSHNQDCPKGQSCFANVPCQARRRGLRQSTSVRTAQREKGLISGMN